MVNRKPVKTRGKLQLSKFFQEFKAGDSVAVVREMSVTAVFPKRLQGRTGVVEGLQGRHYKVKINDQEKPKSFLIAPIHLKKISNLK